MNKKKLFACLLAFVLLVSFTISNFIGPNHYRRIIIDGDGSGLYAYLPTLIIYKSVDFTPVFEYEKSRRAPDYMGHYFHEHDGILINKFTAGTALLQLPFFLIAYILSLIFGLEADGYNILFQFAVALAALFWVFVGILYFIRLALLYNLKNNVAWVFIITGFIGTNLFYYALIAPAASHVYSFSLISIFLYYMKIFFMTYNRKALFLSSLLLALIILIRPVNIVIVLALPFLASSPKNLVSGIKKKIKTGDIFIGSLVFIIGISPQLIINYLQTGNLIIYGYENEGFYFTRPETLNFLLSYRKGWLVYTPLMILLIPALIALFKRSRFEFYSFLGFFIMLIYIFSSWWNWFYGDSFGMRPMIDYYSLFFLVIAIFISGIKKQWLWVIISIFIGIAISLNLIQTIQYAKGIIHPDSMSKEAYWEIFLKTSDDDAGIIAAGDESYYGKMDEKPFFETTNDMESKYNNWSNPEKSDLNAYSGSFAVQMNHSSVYSPSFTYKIPETFVQKNNLYVEVEAMILQNEANAAKDALFIVDISDLDKQTIFYKKFKVKKLPDSLSEEWKIEHIGFKLPPLTDEMDSIKFYIWNLKGGKFMIDDFSIKIYEYH